MKTTFCILLGTITFSAVSAFAQADETARGESAISVVLRPIPIVRESDLIPNQDTRQSHQEAPRIKPTEDAQPLKQSSPGNHLVHQVGSGNVAEEKIFETPVLVSGNTDLDQLLLEIRRIVAPIIEKPSPGEKENRGQSLVIQETRSER